MHPAFAPPRASDYRGWAARVWANPDTRSTFMGVVGVLLIHLLLWLLAPRLLQLETIEVATRPHASAKQFNIELAPEVFEKAPPKPPPPFKFVETNPDAPENTPDKTQNFSNRNQQVAQEKPTPDGRSDRPVTEGKKDFESTAIVTGDRNRPIEHIEAAPPTPQEMPQPQPAATPRAEQNPLPGFEKKQGEDRESFGSNVARFPDNVRPIDRRIEGDRNAPLIQGADAVQPAIDPKRPQPRPQLAKTQNVRSAVLMENTKGTMNVGPVAIDAKWSEYGEYLNRMIEVIDIYWKELLRASEAVPQSGTYVYVTFILDSRGQIARIVKVETHTSIQGERAAISAISDRAPYGPWPEDMKAVLGEQQEMTFRFFYD